MGSRSRLSVVVSKPASSSVRSEPRKVLVLTDGSQISLEEQGRIVVGRLEEVLRVAGCDKFIESMRKKIAKMQTINAARVIRALTGVMGRTELRKIVAIPDIDPPPTCASSVRAA